MNFPDIFSWFRLFTGLRPFPFIVSTVESLLATFTGSNKELRRNKLFSVHCLSTSVTDKKLPDPGARTIA